ncbi:MAG: hypothetical protein DPW09_45275 [Anaerolineae bacterium]|nr:hypothetical protein [Anaerolineae bacterium]
MKDWFSMKLMRKKVLIVGANGLLGQNLLQAFEHDYDRVASNRSDTFILAQPDISYRRCDITKRADVVKLVKDFVPNYIINAAAFLMQRTDDPENRAGKVRQIEEQVQLITRLVNSLLLMARLESSSTLARLPVSMNVIFESLCHAITARYSGGPAIQCEEHPDLPPVMGDPVASNSTTLARRVV